jgi:tetratricopeptide (TPR) repeat protein
VASVFLSYSREDLASARQIARALEAAGHSVWWDRQIKGGAQYAKEIDRALTASDAVVVLWSEHSVDSSWVRDEAEAGRDAGRLVPATLDGSRPPLGFRQYQTIGLERWRRSEAPTDLEELIEALSPDKVPALGAPHNARQRAMRWTTRRKLLSGLGASAAIIAASGGLLLYRDRSHPKAPPEVRSLMVQARQIEDQNNIVTQNQAIGLYERAVKLAPDFAEAWGRLGLICAVCSHYRDRSEALALRAKAQSAGARALQLDPGNVYGEMALAIAWPFIGHWQEWDRRMTRALAREPRNDDLLTYRAVMLQFEGRATQSVPLYQRIRERPLKPAVYNNYIKALWTAARPVELEDAMADAASLYPTHPSIWFTRFQILAFSGRADAALAVAQSAEGRPPGLDEEKIGALVKLARTIGGRNPAEVESIMADQIRAAHVEASQAELSIRNASALGRIDDAYQLANAYYFGRGFTIPDYDSKSSTFSPEQRQTRLLFEPVTAPMRADPRFEPLVARLGFDRYWRESGVPPDYRRS